MLQKVDKIIDLEDWKSIISHPNFKKVRVYITNRVQVIDNELDFTIKNSKPSLDISVQLAVLHAKKQELSAFLSHINYKLKQYNTKEGSNLNDVR